MVNSILSDNNKSKIKAGFLQFEPKLGEPDLNISNIEHLLSQTAGADLVVIPELANSGYNFESKEQAIQLAESVDNSPYLNFLSDQAKKLNLHIVSGFHEIDNYLLYNTSVLIGPNGIIGKYRKIHLFMNEFDFFEKGNLGLPVYDIGFCKVGMLICFDWVFPEVWRILALKGADIICHPSNLVLPYAQQAVPVHGMINKTFNITANRYGTERGVTFSGKSMISNPVGITMVIASSDKDDVCIVDMDINQARNKKITDRNHVINDRFPKDYIELTD